MSMKIRIDEEFGKFSLSIFSLNDKKIRFITIKTNIEVNPENLKELKTQKTEVEKITNMYDAVLKTAKEQLEKELRQIAKEFNATVKISANLYAELLKQQIEKMITGDVELKYEDDVEGDEYIVITIETNNIYVESKEIYTIVDGEPQTFEFNPN